MSGHGFTSAFATELDAYLAFKANMGFTGASRIWYLKQFDAYCAVRDRTVFDQDTVEGWVGVQLQRCGRYPNRFAGLPHDPNRILLELLVELPPCLHRRTSSWRCLHDMRGIPEQLVLVDRGRLLFVASGRHRDQIIGR
jgi:hypothetical protein